jgi:hypothetical protein
VFTLFVEHACRTSLFFFLSLYDAEDWSWKGDMARTEDLNTRLRTLSYDHERLQTMYRSATEKASNAEKEMNLHKSRLA